MTDVVRKLAASVIYCGVCWIVRFIWNSTASAVPPCKNREYMRVWRNWQTRMVQVHVRAISCRFKSCYPHQKIQVLWLGFFYPLRSNGISSPLEVWCISSAPLWLYLITHPRAFFLRNDDIHAFGVIEIRELNICQKQQKYIFITILNKNKTDTARCPFCFYLFNRPFTSSLFIFAR